MSLLRCLRAWALCLLIVGSVSIAPKFSWQTVGNMTFFHACNESGLWSEEALDVIQRFQMVTVEKGQGFTDPMGNGTQAEAHIVAQLAAVKKRDPTIQTIFYMNSVLNWFFYEMAAEYEAMPANWMYDSKTRQPVREGGDKTFQPQPKDGMLIFNHALPAVRAFWKSVCENAVASGFVDGCFSDSSQPDTHGTSKHLNEKDHAAFEQGKIRTMSELTAHFGGQAGQPYPSNASGVLIGKKPDQEGINAFQIEMFRADESQIEVLQKGVAQGYLVQAHIAVGEASGKCGCACIESDLAAFLIGAGKFSYFGFGPWISPDLADVQGRWCPDLFDRPLGEPLNNGTRDENGVWTRAFASGTRVTFFGKNGTGVIHWSEPAPPTPAPPPMPVGACTDQESGVGIAGNDITPGGYAPSTILADDAGSCCAKCYAFGPSCKFYTWYSDGSRQCHFHSTNTGKTPSKAKLQRVSGAVKRLHTSL